MVREPIYGIDTKVCRGCGTEYPIEAFIRKHYETNYCTYCRHICPVCEDWIGMCHGEHEGDDE